MGRGGIVKISSPPSLPGFPGVAWRGALPTIPPELIHTDFGDSCAQQLSQDWGLVPGGLFAHCEAIKARRALIEECKDWRPPWVTWWEPYKHPPGWPELFIDRKPVPPQPADKAKPFQWEVDRADRVAVALRQHLQGVREDAGAVAAKSEVKNELEKISQVSSEPLEKELGACLAAVELPVHHTASASVAAWDPYLNNGSGKHCSDV